MNGPGIALGHTSPKTVKNRMVWYRRLPDGGRQGIILTPSPRKSHPATNKWDFRRIGLSVASLSPLLAYKQLCCFFTARLWPL